MFRIASENELLECFRLIDREEVAPPTEVSFPLLVKDYLAWSEPSGHRVYVVFTHDPKRPPLGVVFRRDQNGGGDTPRMCEWCHSVRTGDRVGLLTATASSNRRVGIQLCRDLSCKDKLETAPGPEDFPRTTAPREEARRILTRMSEFARRNLF